MPETRCIKRCMTCLKGALQSPSAGKKLRTAVPFRIWLLCSCEAVGVLYDACEENKVNCFEVYHNDRLFYVHYQGTQQQKYGCCFRVVCRCLLGCCCCSKQGHARRVVVRQRGNMLEMQLL